MESEEKGQMAYHAIICKEGEEKIESLDQNIRETQGS